MNKKQIKVDVKDKKILSLLAENSRMPLSKIAKKIRLSRDSVSYRVKRLYDKGVIVKFTPQIDFHPFGMSKYHVFLLLDESSPRHDELVSALKKHPATVNLREYSDQWDLEWTIAARSVQEFDDIRLSIMAQFPKIIMDRNKLLVVAKYPSVVLPFQHQEITEKKRTGNYRMDKLDYAILNVLSDDCRVSTYSIAKKIKLSADAIGLRMKKMFNSGIIYRYTVVLDFLKLGYTWYTFALRMKVFDKKDQSRFRMFVRQHPQIIKAVKTLGNWDLLVYVIASTPKEFHTTIKDIKKEFSSTIRRYATFVAYKEHVFRPLPKVLTTSHTQPYNGRKASYQPNRR
ncbi:AsnC family transcriptional regulator [Candidatus Woesearchaeota archaeon]|nr:AsnC family transcriptional regulator [Candidatus Woesearchaeota archaeon]